MNPSSFIEQILFSTLRLEFFDEKDSSAGMGTGFLVRVDLKERPNEAAILLVSNKHVFATSNRFIVNFHTKIPNEDKPNLGHIYQFRTKDFREAYYAHPDERIDLACVNLTEVIKGLYSTIYFKCLSTNFFAKFTEDVLDAGQRIIFIGYPNDRYDRVNNLPIVRDGIIASHPKIDYDGKQQFIIDAQVFPGSSGSPVFLNIKEAELSQGIFIIGPNETPYILLGVVTATMIRNNIIESLPAQYLHTTQEVIGLGIVFKSTALLELLDMVVSKLDSGNYLG